MAAKPDTHFFWLGRYLSLALSLPASVLAGYWLFSGLQHFLHWSFLPLAGIILGTAAGLVKIVQELGRDERRDGGAH